VPIVRRGTKYEGLTPEGERVLVWAHRILGECEELRQDLSTMESGLAATLRIGAIPTTLAVARCSPPRSARDIRVPGYPSNRCPPRKSCTG
jgi:DNA-binding transcriptional LysR family regulator